MSHTVSKKARKCSLCGQEGHNKLKCSSVNAKPAEPSTVYGIRVKEDNGDSTSEWTTLYASIDGLMKGLETQIKSIESESYHEDEDDDEEDDDEEDPPVFVKELYYYTGSEVFKNVPIPTKEYVEKVLSDKRRDYLDGLIIKVGDIDAACYFACEISVHKLKLNP